VTDSAAQGLEIMGRLPELQLHPEERSPRSRRLERGGGRSAIGGGQYPTANCLLPVGGKASGTALRRRRSACKRAASLRPCRGLNGGSRFAARQGPEGPASRVPAFERSGSSLSRGSKGSAQGAALEKKGQTWLSMSTFS
jgi:hypothetical protein